MVTATQTLNDLNGIDVSKLKKAIASVDANPANGQTQWKVRSRWVGGTRSDHAVDGFGLGGEQVKRSFQIKIDEPCELCGTNQFANPQEYLMAATNACMLVGYATVASVMGIKLSKLELEISGDIDLRGFMDLDRNIAPGYTRLYYKVHIGGDGTQAQFEKIHEVVQRTSPNYYNITHAIPMDSELCIEK